ncbi:MAG: orotate phosphoribosyltransferase [Candidatus Thermoplasmatota archaeon]|nr:orotate phosphoribosyltransferase [Candidatus Thermoplasmatota archaeon]
MLKEMLKECGAIKFGKFKLTSGKESNYYIDIKAASLNPKILSKLAKELTGKLSGKEEKIACIELGAVPIATAVALKAKIPFVILRKELREHGTGKQIEGELKEGEYVVVIEDVATTGNSILKVVNAVRERGAIVKRAIVVVDREEGAESLLKENDIELISLIKVSELMK